MYNIFRDYDDAKWNHNFTTAMTELQAIKEMGY